MFFDNKSGYFLFNYPCVFCSALNLDAEVVFFASSAYKSTPEAENAAKKNTHKTKFERFISKISTKNRSYYHGFW